MNTLTQTTLPNKTFHVGQAVMVSYKRGGWLQVYYAGYVVKLTPQRVRVVYWDANKNLKQVTKTISRDRVFAYNHGITDLNLSDRACLRAHRNFSRLQNSTRLTNQPAKPKPTVKESPTLTWQLGQTELVDWGQVAV